MGSQRIQWFGGEVAAPALCSFPETAFREHKTTEFLYSFGIPVERGVGPSRTSHIGAADDCEPQRRPTLKRLGQRHTKFTPATNSDWYGYRGSY